ncbi:MAG: 4-hydroxy-3-methylbut-2-enyl diphosphate reductase [Planctomycetota bacterium]
MRVIVARPRGFCAGVQRAVHVVEMALAEHGAPVYVRKQIVHNSHVVRRLSAGGAVFVEELDEVPAEAVVILSAHGCSPTVSETAQRRGLRIIDATCPLVAKVHREVRRYSARGYRIILIGHRGHDEVIGTLGQVPEHIVLVEAAADVARLDLLAIEKGVILTQTTLSQDDTGEIVAALRQRYPQLELPPSEDICYATQSRQDAVKELCRQVDLLLVVGSTNSSNSRRLVEVAHRQGVAAHQIDGPDDLDADWLTGVDNVGVTSGASTPEDVVQDVLARLGALGVTEITEMDGRDERVTFKLPDVGQAGDQPC